MSDEINHRISVLCVSFVVRLQRIMQVLEQPCGGAVSLRTRIEGGFEWAGTVGDGAARLILSGLVDGKGLLD